MCPLGKKPPVNGEKEPGWACAEERMTCLLGARVWPALELGSWPTEGRILEQ